MKRPKLGIAYSITGNYVLKTIPSLLSILENNQKCNEEEQVDLSVFFYILDIEDRAIIKLQEVCDHYNVPLEINDAKEYIACLQNAGDVAYGGSLVNDLFIAVLDKLNVDYNVLFIENDVVLNHNCSLKELAEYDFENGKKSCASTIELQNCTAIRNVMPLLQSQYIFNCGVVLASPILYQKHNTFKQYSDSVEEKGWKFYPYWNVLRNAYGLRNELCILPMKYQVYPAQKMLKPSQWLRIFGLQKGDYYSDDEIAEAIEAPVFIHYVNFIVKKPWIKDLPMKYRKEGYWPFQDVWNYYADLVGIRESLMECWDKTFPEKVKRCFFDHSTLIYVWLCTVFYGREVKRRNRIIYGLNDADKNLYITAR